MSFHSFSLSVKTFTKHTLLNLLFSHLQQGAFFQKLIDVFDDCENRKDIDGLHMMFNIVKEIS